MTVASSVVARTSVLMGSEQGPDGSLERDAWARGYKHVACIDEVGRGSWAGCLTIGAVIVPPHEPLEGLRDSKKLSPARRESLKAQIEPWAVSWALGHASHEEIDEYGLSRCLALAASRAVASLSVEPDLVFLDGPHNFLARLRPDLLVETFIKGDDRSTGIAAASILAKTARDALMVSAQLEHPHWDFATNKGYASPAHKAGLQQHGLSDIHRRSWSFATPYL